MSNYVSGRRPRGADSITKTVKGFTHEKEDGFAYLVVEKPRQGAPESKESEARERDYELVEDGERKALYRVPIKEYDKTEKEYRDLGNSRLRAKAKVDIASHDRAPDGSTYEQEIYRNDIDIKETSGAEIAAGL